VVYPEAMRRNLDLFGGLVHSQRVLLALTQAGMGREDAYQAVQRNAMRAWQEGVDFLGLLKADAEVSPRLAPEALEACSIWPITPSGSIRSSIAFSAVPEPPDPERRCSRY